MPKITTALKAISQHLNNNKIPTQGRSHFLTLHVNHPHSNRTPQTYHIFQNDQTITLAEYYPSKRTEWDLTNPQLLPQLTKALQELIKNTPKPP